MPRKGKSSEKDTNTFDTRKTARQSRVKVAYFIEFLTIPKIAEKEKVTTRTIERDIAEIRENFRRDGKEANHISLIDIFDEIRLSFQSRMAELHVMLRSYTHNMFGERKKKISDGKNNQILKIIKEIRRTQSAIITEYKRLGLEFDPKLLDDLTRIKQDEKPKEEKPKDLQKLLDLIDKLPETALKDIGDQLVSELKNDD